jgi:succinate-semialdehyde dehydrogenase/glutarate-semialdehyde dehydrogenase
MHTGFYEPTILTEVTTSMPVFAEETFGPVAVIIPFKDVDEAIGIANESPFGLGAGLWTSDMEKAKYAAARIEAGAVFANSMVRSDPRLPFGGSKSSGFGRELHLIGMKEFMNVKTIQFTS